MITEEAYREAIRVAGQSSWPLYLQVGDWKVFIDHGGRWGSYEVRVLIGEPPDVQTPLLFTFSNPNYRFEDFVEEVEHTLFDMVHES